MVHCDNNGTVAVVNSGYSKVAAVMHLLRCLFFIRARFQFALQVIHTPGAQNSWVNAVSSQFILVPGPNAENFHQTIIPEELLALLNQSIDWT